MLFRTCCGIICFLWPAETDIALLKACERLLLSFFSPTDPAMQLNPLQSCSFHTYLCMPLSKKAKTGFPSVIAVCVIGDRAETCDPNDELWDSAVYLSCKLFTWSEADQNIAADMLPWNVDLVWESSAGWGESLNGRLPVTISKFLQPYRLPQCFSFIIE